MQKNVRSTMLGVYGAGFLFAALVFTGCSMTPQAKEAKFLEHGKSYMAQKDYSRATIEFQNAIRARKTDAEPYYQLALAYMAMNDFRTGIPFLKKALDLDPKH